MALSGNIMWVILRGQEDRCIAAITIKKVEQFSEGYHTNDFLIYSNLLRSIRFYSLYDAGTQFSVSVSGNKNLGIQILTDEAANLLKYTILKNVEIKFSAPSGIGNISIKSTFGGEKHKILEAISTIVEKMNLNQLWGSGTTPKLNPVSNFAATLLMKNGLQSITSESLTILQQTNPIDAIMYNSEEVYKLVDSVNRGNIDLSFTEIIPENTYAREFVSGKSSYDIQAALDKTEIAEKTHQSMLRDISEYLLSIKKIPYESSSVDLMVELESGIKIFEIKSANLNNLIAQAAKGSFQIACYATAMKEDFDSVKSALVILKIADKNLEEFVIDSLKYLNISCLVYNPELQWPERVSGLLD